MPSFDFHSMQNKPSMLMCCSVFPVIHTFYVSWVNELLLNKFQNAFGKQIAAMGFWHRTQQNFCCSSFPSTRIGISPTTITIIFISFAISTLLIWCKFSRCSHIRIHLVTWAKTLANQFICSMFVRCHICDIIRMRGKKSSINTPPCSAAMSGKMCLFMRNYVQIFA